VPETAAVPTRGRRNCRRYGSHRRLFNAILGLGAAAVFATRADVAPAAQHVPVILDLGDSLTAGYGLMPEQAFPARLEAWLRAHATAARVVNAGVSGDTTTDGLSRLDWALADKPDLVILALGANDALRGIDPTTVRANLDQMLDKIEAAGAKVLILGMRAPPNWGADYDRAFDRIFPELARAHRAALYPFFLEGVAMKPELNQADGLHPNKRGVGILVSHIGPVVAGLLAQRSGGAS
jgi:acyl-CoA thioesterase I